jgi:hypothetical protein
MNKVCLLLLALCSGAFAQNDRIVRWRGMEGVISAPNVDNVVGQIRSGAQPWTARGGAARIDLSTGNGSFEVDGLVMNGGNSSGSPGPVTNVMGTLVCNAGSPSGTTETAVDTPSAALSPTGDAELSFRINVPANCNNPLFLIRVASGRWIATATKPSSIAKSNY